MGILDWLFRSNNIPFNSAFTEYEHLTLGLTNGTHPSVDPLGNDICDIFRFNIAGTNHEHDGCNPQKIIPKLNDGERAILVPDLQNDVDSEAIKVITEAGKYIGWIPKSFEKKYLLHRRLVEGYSIYSVIFNRGKSSTGFWWCELYIVTYSTPFDLSLQQRKLAGQVAHVTALSTAISLHAAKLSGEEYDFFCAVKNILVEIPNIKSAIQYLDYRDEDNYFVICVNSHEVVKLKLIGGKKYWLFPMPYAQFMREYNLNIECTTASQKESSYRCRLFIRDANDLLNFKDIIQSRFLYEFHHGTTFQGLFPELND